MTAKGSVAPLTAAWPALPAASDDTGTVRAGAGR
jgi:hypothetical protein